MLIFLVFHGSYALAHLYLFLKARDLLPLNSPLTLLLGLFLFVMAFSPMVIYFYSLRGGGAWTKAFAFFGYTWMGLLILFFFPAVFLDIYNVVVVYGGALIGQNLDAFILPPSLSFFIPLTASACLTLYGFFRARSLELRRISIKTDKLPAGVERIKVAQLSDVHLGIIVGAGLLDKAIKRIREERPDLIVSTGDLIDGGIEYVEPLKDRLRSLEAPLGKFAIIGNHEFYTGIKRSQRFLEEAGFVVLRNEGRVVENTINIVGIDDAESRPSKEEEGHKRSEREILSGLPGDRFTLLLKHKPVVDEEALGLFDLQLSGHTHNGQIFPLNIIVRLFFYPHSSYRELSRGSAIYVSGGIGTAGPPVRLFSPPEIPIIEIRQRG
jgi:hypothetical protein